MRRVLLSAGIGLTICAGLAFPADAQRDPGATTRPDTAEVVDRPLTDQPAIDARPTDARPIDRPDIETLRLACNGRITDTGRAGVACEWSQTEQRVAAGYVLVRTDGDTRTTVFRTRDLTETFTVDSEIRLGVTYRYSVLVVDETGTTTGRGGPVRAGVKAPEPETDVEVLTLRCEAATDVKAARCEWRAATSRNAVGYQLWRVVNRGERELVWRGGLDQTAARDDVPNGTVSVRYAVLAVDADGEIVGRSRPAFLQFEDDTDDRPVDTAPTRRIRGRINQR